MVSIFDRVINYAGSIKASSYAVLDSLSQFYCFRNRTKHSDWPRTLIGQGSLLTLIGRMFLLALGPKISALNIQYEEYISSK